MTTNDIDAIRRQAAHAYTRKSWQHIADTVVPALCDEVEQLREQIFAQKPVVEAAQAWAEAHEDNDLVLRIRRPSAHPAVAGLYDAVEQYRLMDLALSTAREQKPEVES